MLKIHLSMKWLFYLFLFVSISTFAQVPGTLSYQGILTDASGNPVADGTSVVTFNFYNVATGGTAIAGTTRGPINVTTTKGLFTVVIGDGTANNAALPGTLFNSEFWVGVTVGVGGTELSPRVRMTAVPYAYRAQVANTLDAGATVVGSQITDGTVSTSDLADAAVTAPKLAANSVTSASITDGSVTTTDITDGAITNTKLGTGIDASKITTGKLPVGQLPSTANATLDLSGGTNAMILPSGTVAQRPATTTKGALRFNTDENVLEYFNGTNWYFTSPKILFLEDAKTPNSDGGASVNSFKKRDINSYSGDLSVVISFAGNNFQLGPGDYLIEASAPAHYSSYHTIRLWNTSSNAAVGDFPLGNNSIGSSEFNLAASQIQTRSFLAKAIRVTSNTTYEIQHYVYNGSSSGLGVGAFGSGENAIFTQIKITKLRGQ